MRNIVVSHRMEIPMCDSSIGLGGDVITTLSYYVLGDPLALLSVFVLRKYTEYLYDFLIIIRLYLSGLVFCAFCKHHGYEESDIFLGCLIYMFSFWSYAQQFCCAAGLLRSIQKQRRGWRIAKILLKGTKLAAELEEAGKFRFDTADLGFEGVKANSAMQYGTNGTSFYYSVTNPATSRYLCDNKMNIYTDIYVRHF